MAATLISAVAQGDARLVNTRKGDRLVAEFRTIEGEDVTLWKMPDDEAFAAIRRNQSVKLVKDSRGWNLLVKGEADGSIAADPQANIEALAPEEKRQIAAYVEQLGDLYAYCQRTALTKLGEDASPVEVSTAAAALFQAARDRFNP